MANIELKFIDSQLDTDFIKVECCSNLKDGDFISVSGDSFGEDFVINLDKSTAIKFAKTLRTEINKIED